MVSCTIGVEKWSGVEKKKVESRVVVSARTVAKPCGESNSPPAGSFLWLEESPINAASASIILLHSTVVAIRTQNENDERESLQQIDRTNVQQVQLQTHSNMCNRFVLHNE